MSYDDSWPTDKDKVRFWVGDTDTTAEKLSDAEINGILAEEGNVMLASARALYAILAKFRTAAGGVDEKQVGDLRIKRDDGQSLADAIRALAEEYRLRATPASRVFKAL